MKNKSSELTRLYWVWIRLNQFEMFVSQHIIRRSHIRSNIIGLVSICISVDPVWFWPHSILIFPISVLALFLQEFRTEVIRSSHDGFQNISNLCVLSCLGRIHWWILGGFWTIEFWHTLVYQVVCQGKSFLIVYLIVMKNNSSELNRLDWVWIRLNQFEMFEERFKLLCFPKYSTPKSSTIKHNLS